MRVGVVGAGVAGLATAKVLRQAGHEVVVFERAPDVGGVWSATRRYPGVSTQSPKATYALSDYPMPADYPEWPSGEQVQRYLAGYATFAGLDPVLRLEHEVLAAVPDPTGWTLTVRTGDRTWDEIVDHLVVANGVFSEPAVPAYEGEADFAAAGGRLLAASDFHDAQDARDRHVLVVGYGKSACDVAIRISETAATTDVAARRLLWKVPKKIGGVVNFKFLLLTRLGEALFRWQYPGRAERVLHGRGNGIRRRMLGSVEKVTARQYRLRQLDLLPAGGIENIVRGAIGLVTDGFYEAVGDGRITVRRDTEVKRLLEKDGAPHAELADGTLLRADLVVCGTGYRQGIGFLDPALVRRLTDGRGNFLLYRQIHPVDVPRLSFAGYNSSFFSPLNAETAAHWIAALLAGRLALPPPEEMQTWAVARVAFMDEATAGHHCHATKIIPFSMHNVDEVLDDLGRNVGRLTRFRQWLGPVDPKAYRKVLATQTSNRKPMSASPAGTVSNLPK